MNVFPMVSVIIPVYNDGLRLKKCLEALENQSYTNTSYEVIVIDNASDEKQNIKWHEKAHSSHFFPQWLISCGNLLLQLVVVLRD